VLRNSGQTDNGVVPFGANCALQSPPSQSSTPRSTGSLVSERAALWHSRAAWVSLRPSTHDHNFAAIRTLRMDWLAPIPTVRPAPDGMPSVVVQ
jgi:hypothetical protein